MTAPTSARLNRVALEHYATTQSFVDATAQVAGDMWSQVDPDNIADSWARQVPELTAVVSGAQLGAAREADAYVGEALEVQDLSDEAVSTVDPAAFAGTASDGRGLLSLLTHPIVVALLTVADIHDVGRAMGAGRRNLDMIVRTQVADASRLADQTSLVAHPAADGYIRQTDGNPCARCLLLSGRFYQWNRGFQRHPRCGCFHAPASSGIQVPDPRRIYDRMSRAERLRAGFSLGDIAALDEGADIFQVVNARRGVFTAGGRKFTREGTTRRGFARSRLGRVTPRLTPDQIFADAASREHAQQLLYRHGYLVEAPRPVTLPRLPSGGRATAGAPVQVRQLLADAPSPEAVSRVLASEYQRITGRTVLVELRGSVQTAREHAEGVLRAVEKYPDIEIRTVRTGKTTRRSSYAEADQVRREVVLSEDWSSVARRQDYLEALAADVRSGWHPNGTGTPAGVAVHEVGHLWDPDSDFVRIDLEELLERAAGSADFDDISRLVASDISRYAMRDERELIADAFAAVIARGDRASALSRSVVRLVDDARAASGVRGSRVGPLPSAQDISRLPVARLTAMVRERGITVPTGLRKPALVRLVDDLDSGKSPTLARQQAVLSITDERRTAADALIRAAELGPANTPRAFQHLGRVLRRDLPPELQRSFAPLLDALDAADLARVQAAIPAVARSAKVRQIGGARGEVKAFKRGEMEWIGDQRSDAVFVIRPGYAATVDGGSVTLRRAAVAPATPEQVAALPVKAAKKAAKAPAKKAPAKKATTAALPSPRVETDRFTQAALADLSRERGSFGRSLAAGRVDHPLLRPTQGAHGTAVGTRPTRLSPVSPERAVAAEDAIREAIDAILARSRHGTEWVSMLALRDELGDRFLRSEVDEALQRLQRGTGVSGAREVVLIPEPDATVLSVADMAASVILGGRDLQLVQFTAARVTVAKAVKKTAAKAAPAKAAKKAAKKAAPKPPPAPSTMTAPALRKELTAAGAPEELLAGVPKPVLARYVTTLRQTGDALGAGRLRQEIIDRRRALAEALAEAAELLDSQASATLLASRAASRLRRVEELVAGWPQEAPLRSLVTAMRTGNPAAIRRAITAAEKRGAVKRIGGTSGDTATFDRKAMSPLGGEKIPDGAQVRVVRPGYEVDIAGERVVIMRPVVEAVPEAPRIDRTLSPERIVEQEQAARSAALAAPPIKLQDLDRSARGRPLKYYQRFGDVHMLGLMRRGKVGRPHGVPASKIPAADQVQESIDAIRRLMDESRLTEGITLYRGMAGFRRIFRNSDQPGSLVGRTFTDKGFVSTSADRHTAMGFMVGEEFDTDGILMEIRVPPGTGAIQISNPDYVGRAPSPVSEQEILLQDGLRFRIVSDEMVDDVFRDRRGAGTGRPYRHVVVEVIP